MAGSDAFRESGNACNDVTISNYAFREEMFAVTATILVSFIASKRSFRVIGKVINDAR